MRIVCIKYFVYFQNIFSCIVKFCSSDDVDIFFVQIHEHEKWKECFKLFSLWMIMNMQRDGRLNFWTFIHILVKYLKFSGVAFKIQVVMKNFDFIEIIHNSARPSLPFLLFSLLSEFTRFLICHFQATSCQRCQRIGVHLHLYQTKKRTSKYI